MTFVLVTEGMETAQRFAFEETLEEEGLKQYAPHLWERRQQQFEDERKEREKAEFDRMAAEWGRSPADAAALRAMEKQAAEHMPFAIEGPQS